MKGVVFVVHIIKQGRSVNVRKNMKIKEVKNMGKMDRKKAIKYLEKKGKINEREFTETEEEEIQKVMKQGKIYGDPMVVLSE